jgi:hypothetical protein
MTGQFKCGILLAPFGGCGETEKLQVAVILCQPSVKWIFMGLNEMTLSITNHPQFDRRRAARL